MPKHKKYTFDPKTLQYKEVKESRAKKMAFQFLSFLASGLVFAAITLFIAYNTVGSPNERLLKSENENLKQQYALLSTRMQTIEQVLKSMEERDNSIYRTIFEAEPIPEEVRKAGFGGSNRYENLKKLDRDKVIATANERLDIVSKQIAIQSKSYDEILKLIEKREEILSHTPAIQPVANKDLKRMASGYGLRIDPVYKTKKFHHGMDFTAPTGTPIYATADGVVKVAQRSHSGYGNQIHIEYSYGYLTRYGHCHEIFVKEGQQVKRGQKIATVGSTGKSTGPHCHYEVHKDGTDVNPIDYYFSALTPEEFSKMLQQASQEGQSFD